MTVGQQPIGIPMLIGFVLILLALDIGWYLNSMLSLLFVSAHEQLVKPCRLRTIFLSDQTDSLHVRSMVNVANAVGRTLVEPIHSLQGAYSIIHAVLKQAGRNPLLGSSKSPHFIEKQL